MDAFAALAALVFSPEIAAIVGPYLVILLGATLGAYFRLSQRGTVTRAGAAAFFFSVAGVAVLLTVPICNLTQHYLSHAYSEDSAWMFGPMAFGIGLVGERWPQVGQWIGRKFSQGIDVMIRLRGGK